MLKYVYYDKICEPTTFFSQIFGVTLNVYKSTLKWQNHVTIQHSLQTLQFNDLTDG